jgi:hypothetical protein
MSFLKEDLDWMITLGERVITWENLLGFKLSGVQMKLLLTLCSLACNEATSHEGDKFWNRQPPSPSSHPK